MMNNQNTNVISAPQPLLINAEKAAQLVGGICTRTLRMLVKEHGFPIVRLGNRVMFDPIDIRKWIEEQKARAAN